MHELKRLGQSAGLVELHVDAVIFTGERVEVGSHVHALVGADRDDVLDVAEKVVGAGRERLLHERDMRLGAGAHVLGEIRGAPRLVRVDYELGIRCGAPDCVEAGGIAVAAELHFEQAIALGCLGRRRHRLRCPEAQREAGDDGLRRRKSGKLPRRLAASLRLEVPERAVNGVSRRARRHFAAKRLAVAAGVRALDRCDDALNRLAVARVGDAFAAPDMRAVTDLADNDGDLGPRPARDHEGACDRPGLGPRGDSERHGLP